jgi:hypothetical protein
MAATGPGLEDVLALALKGAPSASERGSPHFGAAGRRGLMFDTELSRCLQPAPELLKPLEASRASAGPVGRMFGTRIGQQAANAAGSEPAALAIVERLCVETMAGSLRLTGQAREDDRLLVMPSRQGRPPILMLMSPEVAGVQESRAISRDVDLPLDVLSRGLQDAADPHENTPEAAVFREMLAGGPQALAEAFSIAQPEAVLTRRPAMMRLCVPSPLMRIQCGETLSTAGVFCRDADGELGVTGCYHGTGPAGTEVVTGKQKSKVKRASEVQDLVFIPLPGQFEIPQMAGLGGVQDDREPARSDRVHFSGIINQNRETRIFGTDAGLLRARPTIMLKLQTDPDTDQGDSGSALLDRHDKVLGFAFERTAYEDYPQFTDWIWAANALRALELVPFK